MFDEKKLKDPGFFRENRADAHSDHRCFAGAEELEAGASSLRFSLNGLWKFFHAVNPGQVIPGFEDPAYDCGGWDDIPVPAHIQLCGYGAPQYANTQYPWDGHEDILPGQIPERFNPVACYVKSFRLPEHFAGKRVFIVGCGGAGSALATACCYEKAASLVLADLDGARVSALAEKLNALGLGTRVEVCGPDWGAAATQAELVVNATPMGLHPGEPSALPPECFHPGQFVLDIVPTVTFPPTASAARAAGAVATDGLDFLVGQGAKSFELWTGLAADRAAMRASLS